MRLGVGLVHVAADGDAPLAGCEGKPHIGANRGEHDHHIDPAEIPSDEARDHQQLDRGRDRVQHRHPHDRIDAGHAALDDAVKPPGAALQMKAQGERVQMAEGAVGELTHGMLRDRGEPHVADLREQHHQHAADAIGHDQHGWHGGKAERRKRGRFTRCGFACEDVDHRLVGDRYRERDGLGEDERAKRNDHAEAQIGPIGRPSIGKQFAQYAQLPRPRLKHGVASRLRQPVLHERSLLSARGPRGKKGSVRALPNQALYRRRAPPRQARQGLGNVTSCCGWIRSGL